MLDASGQAEERGDGSWAETPERFHPLADRRRALEAIGVTRLEQLQQQGADDLLAVHGVGPKAIAILRAAVAHEGLSFLPD